MLSDEDLKPKEEENDNVLRHQTKRGMRPLWAKKKMQKKALKKTDKNQKNKNENIKNKMEETNKREKTKEEMAEELKAQRKEYADSKTGVIYLNHLPYGFFENEIRGYFSQFGTVEKVKVARSKKTGNSRGFGFVKFASAQVAKIAARAMNNYLMFDELIKCGYVPPEKVHPNLFDEPEETTRERFVKLYNGRVKGDIRDTEEYWIREVEEKNRKVAAFGIDYQLIVQPNVENDVKTHNNRKSKKEVSTTKMEPKTESACSVNGGDLIDDSTERILDEAYVMVVDSSEDEVTFRTPPGVVKQQKKKPWKKVSKVKEGFVEKKNKKNREKKIKAEKGSLVVRTVKETLNKGKKRLLNEKKKAIE